MVDNLSVLVLGCGSWHLPQTARTFSKRNALAGLWITFGNHSAVPDEKFRRAWPFQAAMLPLYRFAPQIWQERAFYAFLPLWKLWLKTQSFPSCNVIHALAGYGTEAFDRADRTGALKVLDCPNSHPVTYHGFWQRECDLWCPGEKVPIPQWMFARMNRELERADVIVVQSQFCRESMIMNGIPPGKVFINPMGVDLSLFFPRNSAPPTTRFVCVGTICLRKGHQYLFRAWDIVRRRIPDAELVCVGDYKSDFRRERRKWEGQFNHRRYLTHPEIADLLKTCTAFVFPSQEEGIGRAQIEAMACALPVIGTHEAGTTTLVEDGVEGYIVRGRDPEHIADAMLRAAADRDLNKRMGEAAYRKVATTGSWQHYGDRLLARYGEMLANRQR